MIVCRLAFGKLSHHMGETFAQIQNLLRPENIGQPKVNLHHVHEDIYKLSSVYRFV